MGDVKILLVEDESIEAMDIKRILESFGYEVPHVARSGNEAIVKAFQILPDIILMDIVLKGEINGIGVASKIKDLDIPVIYLTAHSEESTVQKAKHTEPYGYLIKPYDPMDLKNAIELALYRHEMENKLRKSEERYRSILENIQDAYFRADPEGRILMASPSAASMYHYKNTDELIGVPTIILYKNPEDRDSLMEKLKKHGKIEDYECEGLRNDGTSFWVSMNVQYHYDDQGKVQGTEGFMRDITQRKNAENQIKKSENYYRTIFEHTGTATILIDQDMTISLANSEFERLSGFMRNEIEGRKKWPEFVAREDLDRMKNYHDLRRNKPDNAPETYEFKFITRHGSVKDILLNVASITGTKKSVASLLDITGRKKDEEKINRLYRLYATISQVNQAVVRIGDAEELFTRICQICVDYGKFKMAWMGMIDDATGNLTPVSHYGYDDGYLEEISINIREKSTLYRHANTVGETGELVVIEDIKNEPNIGWGPEALKRGYKSLAMIPVKLRGDLIGILNIYSSEAGFFSDKYEVELVREMGSDISMAIDSIETDNEREKMVKALHESEKNLRFSNEWLAFAQKASKSGFWDWDMGTEKLTWSPEFFELFGLPSAVEPSFETWLELIHPDDREMAMGRINHAIENHEFLENEYRIIHQDGDEIWISALGTTYYDGKGKPLRMSGICLDITEQKIAQKGVEESLKEKDVLLREIHHRVKNNMQIVSSLINLQAHRLDDLETKTALKESQNRIKSMAMIHEKLYQSDDLSHINFADYVENMVRGLFYSYNVEEQVELVLDVDEVQLNIETAVPCGLIISELVSNSLKYAFPPSGNGKIRISLQKQGDEYELTLGDDGVGFPEELDYRKTESLGLQLVNTLVNQLEGEMELDRSQGTEFKIRFIELQYKERI